MPVILPVAAFYFTFKYAADKYILLAQCSKGRISYARRSRVITNYSITG